MEKKYLSGVHQEDDYKYSKISEEYKEMEQKN